MKGAPTTMGGDRSRFPSTSLSHLVAGDEDPAERLRAQMLRVSASYWKPIYFYIRRSWSKSDADAKDLTQAFLVYILEHDLVGRFDRSRGNFRTYLRRCLSSFLGNELRDASRLKRGGGRPLLSLDLSVLPDVPRPKGSPDEEFDRDWAMETLDRCLREVEEELRRRGKELHFQIFRAIALEASPEGDPSYREVGIQFGISESDVRNYLRVVRQELRQQILRAASEYVVDEWDVFAEMADILSRSR